MCTFDSQVLEKNLSSQKKALFLYFRRWKIHGRPRNFPLVSNTDGNLEVWDYLAKVKCAFPDIRMVYLESSEIVTFVLWEVTGVALSLLI